MAAVNSAEPVNLLMDHSLNIFNARREIFFLLATMRYPPYKPRKSKLYYSRKVTEARWSFYWHFSFYVETPYIYINTTRFVSLLRRSPQSWSKKCHYVMVIYVLFIFYALIGVFALKNSKPIESKDRVRVWWICFEQIDWHPSLESIYPWGNATQWKRITIIVRIL